MNLPNRFAEIKKETLKQRRKQEILNSLQQSIHRSIVDEMGSRVYQHKIDRARVMGRIKQILKEMSTKKSLPLTSIEEKALIEKITDDVLGYGPLEPLLADPEITEIMVNNAKTIYVEKKGRIEKTNIEFMNHDHLRRIIDKIVAQVGRRVDESSPMVDARLPDGSRVNVIIPPLAINGSKLTIRKFAADPLQIGDLINFGTLNQMTAVLLKACVKGRLNTLVSGGTGSGKTTTLNVLSSFIPKEERIVTIEDSVELQLHQEHVLQLEARPPNIEGQGQVTIRDLVRNSLRMRPDRIIVGEVRGGEALDMLQAMNTGHDGSLSTVHANSPRDALSRIETMTLMAGFELPERAIREQMASAIDLIIHQARFRDGTRRITYITEVTGMEGNVITTQDIFAFDFSKGVDTNDRHMGELESSGIRPKFMDKLKDQGIRVKPEIFEVPDS